MQHTAMPTYMEPQWFVPLFVLLWFTLCGLLAQLSGWRSLAGRFPAQSQVEGERFRFSSGSMEASPWFPVSYSGSLFVTVGKAGLGMSLLFLFRFLNPPLFIPWEQVESVQEKPGFFGRRALVRFKHSSSNNRRALFGVARIGGTDISLAHSTTTLGAAKITWSRCARF